MLSPRMGERGQALRRFLYHRGGGSLVAMGMDGACKQGTRPRERNTACIIIPSTLSQKGLNAGHRRRGGGRFRHRTEEIKIEGAREEGLSS